MVVQVVNMFTIAPSLHLYKLWKRLVDTIGEVYILLRPDENVLNAKANKYKYTEYRANCKTEAMDLLSVQNSCFLFKQLC